MVATRRLRWLVALLAVSLAPPRDARASPTRWSADLGRSQIVVHVYKKGLLSGMAHDHHFGVGNFRATATLDETPPSRARFEVIIAADSLRDGQPDLSPEDRAKVDAQSAGAGVLDAHRYPEIRFAPSDSSRATSASNRTAGSWARWRCTTRSRWNTTWCWSRPGEGRTDGAPALVMRA